MLIVTTNGIPGYRIEAVLGQVMGMTVRSANLGSNIAAGFRSLGGGEHPELTNVVYESRNEVMNRMWSECLRRGGNAVVGMLFDTSDLGKNFTEVCAFGTAVVVTPIPEGEPGATPQSIARAAAENPGPGNWPRMEQGAGAPAAAADFGAGHRPGAGTDQAYRPDQSGQQWQPPETAGPATGLDGAPTNVTQPAQDRGESAAARPGENAEPQPPGAEGHPRPGHDPRQRPAGPQEQRPNAGDSWLDLG